MMHDFKSVSQFDAETFHEGLVGQQQEGRAIQLMLPEDLQIVPTVLDALKILHHLFKGPIADITGENYSKGSGDKPPDCDKHDSLPRLWNRGSVRFERALTSDGIWLMCMIETGGGGTVRVRSGADIGSTMVVVGWVKSLKSASLVVVAVVFPW